MPKKRKPKDLSALGKKESSIRRSPPKNLETYEDDRSENMSAFEKRQKRNGEYIRP